MTVLKRSRKRTPDPWRDDHGDDVTEVITGWRDDDWREATVTSFPAVTDAGAEPVPVQRCRCGMPGCPDSPPPAPPAPGTGVTLSCAAGVTSHAWWIRVASGEWDDVPSLFDRAHAATHLPALEENRRIHAVLAVARHDIAALLVADPRAHADPALGRDLAAIGDRITGGTS